MLFEVEEKVDKKITISDIADALGVSKTTVSRAISGKGRIGKETKAKIMKYISEHNYTPSAIAKALANSTTYNISWVVPGDYSIVELPFFQRCLNGVTQMASSMEYDVIITTADNDDLGQLQRAVNNHKVDGVILSRTTKNDAVVKYLQEVKMPFVAIGMAEESVVQIDNDHLAGCKELTSLLIFKGCNNIGLIGGNSSYMVNQKRLSGYMEAYESTGRTYDENMVYLDVDGVSRTEQVVKELLDKKADCIICMDDSICMHVLNKLKVEGVRIPEDIKVASFYNSSVLDMYSPSISTLNFNAAEIGREAFKVLYDLMDGRQIFGKTLLGYDVVLKESTK